MLDRIDARAEAALLSEREGALLNTIIERHLQTAEPVSSNELCTHYALGCSSATVRNIMARLEEAGFLGHPYTSAGKIPTHKAYRYFVGRLLRGHGVEAEDGQRLSPELLHQAHEADQILKLTSGVLAAVSRLLAVSWVTGRQDERLMRVDLISLSSSTALLVIFTDRHDEIHQIFETGKPVSRELLARIASWVNDHAAGLNAEELETLARSERPEGNRQTAELLRQALVLAGASLSQPVLKNVVVEGAVNLMSQPEFNNLGMARRLVSMLDHREELVQTFEAPGIEHEGLRIAIQENAGTGLPALACITIGIGFGGRSAQLGIMGPMRMAYGRVMSLLNSAAPTVSEALEQAG